jgi:hypothetical protein
MHLSGSVSTRHKPPCDGGMRFPFQNAGNISLVFQPCCSWFDRSMMGFNSWPGTLANSGLDLCIMQGLSLPGLQNQIRRDAVHDKDQC